MKSKAVAISSAILVLIVGVVYGNVLNSGFVNFDDPLYLLERVEVHNGLSIESIRWALTSTVEGNWIPLTWFSYLLDVSLFGVNARGHHAVNLLLHLINTLLLLTVMYRMTGFYWRSMVVAALFALHPLHVESVAWIAERKDVLSGCFFMLTLLAYHAYIKSPAFGSYLIVVISFFLGLCSKSMLVTLPFLLLLLDYWPYGRYGRRSDATQTSPTENAGITTTFWHLFLEKVPLFIIAFAVICLTFGAQKRIGAVQAAGHGSMVDNVSAALVNYVTYIHKSLVPINLAVVYPYNTEIPLWQPIVAAMLMLAVIVIAIRFRCEAPYILTGWLWFTGTLVPVVGLVRLGDQSVADRYTYIPLIGLFILIVWGCASTAQMLHVEKRVRYAAAVGGIGVLSWLCWLQVGYWRDSITLFRHAISVTDGNWVAYNKLAEALLENGDISQSLECARESFRINPRNPFVYMTLGLINHQQFNHKQAVTHFSKAVELNPQNAMAHFLLGRSLVLSGDVEGATIEYDVLLNLNAEKAFVLLNGIQQMQRSK